MKCGLIIVLLTISLSIVSMDRPSQRRPDDEKARANNKKNRTASPVEEIKRDLLSSIYLERLQSRDFSYDHCDASFVDTVIDVVHYHKATGHEDQHGYEAIQYVFTHDIYHGLAKYLVLNEVVNNKRRVYHPDRLFPDALVAQNSLRNAELLLQVGADPNIALPYPIVRENRIEHVPMCGLSVLTKEEDIPRLRLLLRYGANPNIKGKEENPLYCAILSRRRMSRSIVSLLLYYGANSKQPLLSYKYTELGGRTPIESAAEKWRNDRFSFVARDVYELCLNGAERRTQKMACYLWRLINGNGIKEPLGINGHRFPLELCFGIVAHLYGDLKPKTTLDSLKHCSFNKIRIKR